MQLGELLRMLTLTEGGRRGQIIPTFMAGYPMAGYPVKLSHVERGFRVTIVEQLWHMGEVWAHGCLAWRVGLGLK